MTLLKKIRTLSLLCFFLLALPALAADAFVVKDIEIDGLQRIPRQTVLEYLPVHVGQTLTPADTSEIIRALYQTNFFSDVKLSRRGDTLVIQVIERSTIGLIKISGNKELKTKDLMSALKQVGITEGEVYDQAIVDGMKQALIEQYHKTGRYNASVDVAVTPETRNRVQVDIHIDEGKVAKVTEIKIVGNHSFSTRQLESDFKMKPKPFWLFFSSRDHYSEENLQEDINSLQNFYFDRGYLKFRVDSQDVQMSPDKKTVVITLYITEGPVYHVKGYTLSGDLLGQEAILHKFITFKPNEVFSRKKILAINDAVGRYYGDQGYATATVNAIPTLDDVNHTVFINFQVNPGKRVYVRNIDYFGNTKTSDQVMRRETRQLEGGVYSISQQEETKRRLNNLGYLENIESKIEPVPGKDDQVDLKYNVKEASSMTASAQVGYSDAYGLIYGANVTQKNFGGEGKIVSLGFDNSQYAQTYSFSYFNPYYTESGMSRGFSMYYQKVTPNQTNIAAYTLDSYGAMMNYRMPISEYDYLSFGYGYEYLSVNSGDNSTQILNFIQQHGDTFNNVKITAGWTHNTYDRAILPTRGFNQFLGVEAGLPILPKSLQYYRFNYEANYYKPLGGKGFILNLDGTLGYGNGYGDLGVLPFFKNFYAGGMGTVRGYQSNSLGPRDSVGNALGGNLLTAASANLIFPNMISENRLRTSLFFDAGNVFQNTIDTSQIRYSAGLEVDWISPMGPLKVSLGQALNSQPGDNLQFINFAVGTSF